MKTIYTLSLIAAGAVFINGPTLDASEAGRIELSFNKSHAFEPHLGFATNMIGAKTSAPVSEPADFRFQDEVGVQLVSPVRSEGGAPLGTVSSQKIELRAPKPNNVVQSKKHPGIEYSGILVQMVKNNPLQVINPFAPAQYGDGEANTVRDIVTTRAEGLNVLSIHF